MSSAWKLNPKEVYWYGGTGTISRRKNKRQSRIIDEKDAEINLVHIPTQIEVNGMVQNGNYSKKEMVKLQEILYQKLFIELENKVAKHLRIAKR